MSLYVKVFCSLFNHRKTIRLKSFLGDDAYWIPIRLWAYAAQNQPDGILKDYSASEIAEVIGYKKDATSMLEALLEARFLDSDPLRIHDWEQYNSYHSRYSERAHKAAKARWNKSSSVEPKKDPPVPPKEEEEVLTERERRQALHQACLEHPTSIKTNGDAHIPTLDEVLVLADARGISTDSARSFFNYHQDNNLWLNQFQKLINWESKLITWATNDRAKLKRPERNQIDERIEPKFL